MIYFHFYDKDKVLNKAIEKMTFGRWSHVSIEIDGKVYEAIGGRLFGQNGVLQSGDKEDYHRGRQKAHTIKTIAIDVPTKDAKDYLFPLIGTSYGYGGIWRFVLPWLSGKYKGRYCSKLAAEVYMIATGQNLAQKEVSVNALFDIVTAKTL
jgi:hypothetical protein